MSAGSAREVTLSGGQPEALKRIVLYRAVAAVFFVLVSVIAGRAKKRYGNDPDEAGPSQGDRKEP
jgi:cation transporter-like permease